MSKNDMYEVNKNIEKLLNGGYTNFINPNYLKLISYRLKRDEYNIYYPYDDCDKVILYTSSIPKIRLFEIVCSNSLRHSDILGSLFGLNISNEVFGDIVIYNNKYYVFFMDDICDYVMSNLTMIGNNYVKLKEVSIDILSSYKREYERYSYIVSSIRIDNVIAKVIGTSRDRVKDMIKNNEIILNYDVLVNNSYTLKDGDIFSIRKFGKYKYMGIEKKTKKDNYIIILNKYV